MCWGGSKRVAVTVGEQLAEQMEVYWRRPRYVKMQPIRKPLITEDTRGLQRRI